VASEALWTTGRERTLWHRSVACSRRTCAKPTHL
jgi:hypothetical protein